MAAGAIHVCDYDDHIGAMASVVGAEAVHCSVRRVSAGVAERRGGVLMTALT